jgi:chromosome segregation ATPase
MSAPLTDAEIAAMKSTATDLLEAIRLDDSIAGWPEHFDDDFHEAAGPEQVLALLDALASVTTERNELLEKHERLKGSYVANPEHWRSRCTMLETEIERCRAEVNAARAESEKMRQNRTGAGKRCRCCGSDFGHLRDDIDFKATTIAELRDALAAAEAKLAACAAEAAAHEELASQFSRGNDDVAVIHRLAARGIRAALDGAVQS